MVYNKDKRHRNRSSSDDDSSGDDSTRSVASDRGSVASELSTSDGENTEWSEALFQGIDDMTERVTSKRLAALETIRKSLAHHYAGDVLGTHVETLLHGVSNLFQKGSAQDQSLVADILALFIINMGANELAESRYREVCDMFETKLRNAAEKEGGEDETVLIRTVRALGVWRFMSETPAEVARRDGTLDQLRDNFWRGPAALSGTVLAHALDAFALIASGLPASMRDDIVLPRYKPILVQYLSGTNIDIRVAAGRALALLYEARQQSQNQASGASDADDTVDAELQKVIEEFEELVDESSKQHSKKNRSNQRQAFRAFLHTLADGESPVEKLTIAKHAVTFEGWPQIIALDTIRDLVGQGLSQHFKHNPHVREILGIEHSDFDASGVQKLSSLQKKQILSKQSADAKADRAEKNKLTRNARSFSVIHDDENVDFQ